MRNAPRTAIGVCMTATPNCLSWKSGESLEPRLFGATSVSKKGALQAAAHLSM